jgi:hypothetical protein
VVPGKIPRMLERQFTKNKQWGLLPHVPEQKQVASRAKALTRASRTTTQMSSKADLAEFVTTRALPNDPVLRGQIGLDNLVVLPGESHTMSVYHPAAGVSLHAITAGCGTAGDVSALDGGFVCSSMRLLGNAPKAMAAWPNPGGMPTYTDGTYKLVRMGWGLISWGTRSVRSHPAVALIVSMNDHTAHAAPLYLPARQP